MGGYHTLPGAASGFAAARSLRKTTGQPRKLGGLFGESPVAVGRSSRPQGRLASVSTLSLWPVGVQTCSAEGAKQEILTLIGRPVTARGACFGVPQTLPPAPVADNRKEW